jgi:Na+-transporting methylmalonyl-CoA/oxaloacetate decarboxylase gamma subunit
MMFGIEGDWLSLVFVFLSILAIFLKKMIEE